MERRVWGAEDIDVSPVLLMVALVKSGALLLGAFLDGRMRGFAFSVPGDRHGHRLHWSHMTGVDEALRSSGLGTQLKLEQARRVAARGYSRIQWTYDPLQSLNAHLNLVKLGASADEYAEHVYGDSTSDLHRGAPTDRFIATWLLDDGWRADAIAAPGSRRRTGGRRRGHGDDAGRLGRVPRGRVAADGTRHPRAGAGPVLGDAAGGARPGHGLAHADPRAVRGALCRGLRGGLRSAATATAANTCW